MLIKIKYKQLVFIKRHKDCAVVFNKNAIVPRSNQCGTMIINNLFQDGKRQMLITYVWINEVITLQHLFDSVLS